MGRWEPDARGRLERAAFELYAERGYEQTTVADIADHAGLTKRTFFRHFADKREVLFSGSGELERQMVDAVAGAPGDATPMQAVTAALDAAGATLGDRRPYAVQRHAIVASSVELQERELIKLSTLSAALAAALRERGVDEPVATLAAEVGIGVFRVGFERWVGSSDEDDLAALMRRSVDEIHALTTAPL